MRGHGWLSRLQPESKIREFRGGRGERKMWSEIFLAESQDKVDGLTVYSDALRRAFNVSNHTSLLALLLGGSGT